MSEDEIVRKYRRNGKDSKQVKILAELNGVSTTEIIKILAKHGQLDAPKQDKRRLPKVPLTPEGEQHIIDLRNEGLTLKSIHTETKYSIAVIRRVLRDAGIKTAELSKKKEESVNLLDLHLEDHNEEPLQSDSTAGEILVKLDERINRAEQSVDFLKASRNLIIEIVEEINCQKIIFHKVY